MRPIIGISSAYDYDKNFAYLKYGYYNAIIKSGGIPFVIPATDDLEVVDCILDKVDGVLLSGGPDVDARLFNELNLSYNGGISPVRDAMEIYLARETFGRKKPLVGICRGEQVLNVAFGGTLYQDIFSQIKDRELIRHSQDAPVWYPVHDIKIESDSKVSKWFKNDPKVNSFHHQAIKDVAEGFKVVAKADDGIIEAIEYVGDSYVVGVQWHPETMWEKNSELLNMFIDFVERCK